MRNAIFFSGRILRRHIYNAIQQITNPFAWFITTGLIPLLPHGEACCAVTHLFSHLPTISMRIKFDAMIALPNLCFEGLPA